MWPGQRKRPLSQLRIHCLFWITLNGFEMLPVSFKQTAVFNDSLYQGTMKVICNSTASIFHQVVLLLLFCFMGYDIPEGFDGFFVFQYIT